ncbi:MAG: hypothetical protein WCR49_00330, partial [Opitutae bacterium]
GTCLVANARDKTEARDIDFPHVKLGCEGDGTSRGRVAGNETAFARVVNHRGHLGRHGNGLNR